MAVVLAPKVAIYTRVSTHWQVDKDSLQVQRRELIAYAEMLLGIKDYVVFEDAGYSAKNTDRPEFQHMMSRLRSGEFSHLLVWKIDRISRNIIDFATMFSELKRLGVSFVSKNEQFDTSTAIGEAILKIILVFAELERNMTAERVTAVMNSRASNGQWNGGRVPYGYSYSKSTREFSINEHEARTVRMMYDTYHREQSIGDLTNFLNANNITTRSGKPWSIVTVHKILTNIFYIGTYRYNISKQGSGKREAAPVGDWITIESHHEPIINEALYYRVQSLLARNRRGVKAGRSVKQKYTNIFSGLLLCGNCGEPLYSTTSEFRADGTRVSKYICKTHRDNKELCDATVVSDTVIAPFVLNYISNIINAKSKIKPSSTPQVLQKLLLKGTNFYNVASVSEDALEATLILLRQGDTGFEYSAASSPVTISEEDEKAALMESKRKAELRLNRVRSLYLNGSDSITEDDFKLEYRQITEQIVAIEKQLAEIVTTISKREEETFVSEASYFMMVKELLSTKEIDYLTIAKRMDTEVIRRFLRNIISTVKVYNKRVLSIEFSNGILHRFNYQE